MDFNDDRLLTGQSFCEWLLCANCPASLVVLTVMLRRVCIPLGGVLTRVPRVADQVWSVQDLLEAA